MADHDEDVPAVSESEMSQHLQDTLRAFEITLLDGTVERVFAHYWSDDNPGGNVHFCTVLPSGRMIIQNAFSGRHFVAVHEITPAAVTSRIDKIARHEKALMRGKKAVESLKRPDRRVH